MREETRADLLVGCPLLLSNLKKSKRHKILYNFRLSVIITILSVFSRHCKRSDRQKQTDRDMATFRCEHARNESVHRLLIDINNIFIQLWWKQALLYKVSVVFEIPMMFFNLYHYNYCAFNLLLIKNA
jgi:hypothetical protein